VLDTSILRDLGVILVTAAGFALIARPLRVPSIIAYILAGLALGPFGGLVEVSGTLELTSQLGVALLLFLVGLELSFEKIKGVGKVALAAGLGQVAFTVSAGFGLALLMGLSTVEGLFVATAMTFSSTVVPVKLLGEKKELDSYYGRMAVGVFMVQNLVVIVFLTLLAGMGVGGAAGQGGGGGMASVGVGVAKAFGGMALLLVLALVVSRYVLAHAFGWISVSLEALFIWSVSWCFVFVLVAEALGLSLEIGAFLAGISLAQLPYSLELRRRVHPLVNFFIAIFFVTLGIQMDLSGGPALVWPASVFSLLVLIGNPLSVLVIMGFMGYGVRPAFLAGVTVAQISEFSFIFAAMGMSTGLIGAEMLSVVTFVGLVTMAGSAYLILYNHQIYERLRSWGLFRFMGRAREEPVEGTGLEAGADAATGLRDHVIVVGMNSLGRRIVTALRERKVPTLAVDTDPSKLASVGAPILVGNTDDVSVLESAGLAHAKVLVSALQIEDANALLTYRCRSFGVPCSIHAFDLAVASDLREIGADHLMDSKTAGTRRLTEALGVEGIYG